jgi:hypothetical protein
MPRPYLIYHRTDIWPQQLLRTRCAGEKAQPARAPVLAALARRARWAWGRTGPFRRAPVAMPSPSEPGPPLHLRPFVGALQLRPALEVRQTTAARAGALEPPVNAVIDTTYQPLVGVLAQKPPMPCPKGHHRLARWHTCTTCHALADAVKMLQFQCCNFRPTGPFGTAHSSCWVRHGWYCKQARLQIATGFHERYTHGTSRRMASCLA